MTQTPLITTIIPTFERPALLKRAVASALAQDVERHQICIFDNASCDETEAVGRELAQADSRVVYVRRPTNIGSTANFNAALADVTTPYFSCLSDDDVLLPGFYAHALADLEADRSVDFWCGQTAIVDGNSNLVRIAGEWPPGKYEAGRDSMLRMIASHFPWNGVLWRRSILKSVPALDEYGSDDNFIVRVAAHHSCIVGGRVTAVLMLHDGGWTGGMLSGGEDQAKVSEYLNHIIGRPQTLIADIERERWLDPVIRGDAIRAVRRELRHDLLAHLLFRAIPERRYADIGHIRRTLAESGASGSDRAIATTLALASRVGVLTASAPVMAKIRDLRTQTRLRRSGRNQTAQSVRATLRLTTTAA